ncbi:MAG: M16 family metallopeptidase, partial [Planctomycetota bacterium]
GRDQNAFTSFEQTAYTLDLPQSDSETLKVAFQFLSDVASRLTFPESSVENERRVILEERRTGLGSQMRLMQQLWPQIMPGARIVDRLPIGTEACLKAATPDALRCFYRRWYRPDRLTLIVVGDIDPDAIFATAEETWGAIASPGKPAPPDPSAGIPFFREPRAAVASDPEVSTGDLEISCIDPDTSCRTTYEVFESELALAIAVQTLNLRLARYISEGGSTFRSANFSTSSFLRQARWTGVSAACEAVRWKSALDELTQMLRVALAHGFTEREIEAMIRQIRRSAESSVEAESTIPADVITNILLDDVNSRRTTLSAVQHLEVLDDLLPAMSVERVTEAYRERFDVERASYVVISPSAAPERPAASSGVSPPEQCETDQASESGGVAADARVGADSTDDERQAVAAAGGPPSRDEIAAAMQSFLAHPVSVHTEGMKVDGLLAEPPVLGTIRNREQVEDLGITHWTLENGVIVHHKFNDFQRDAVQVSILVGGGVIDETIETRGRTEVAVAGLNQPATSRLSSADIRELVLGHTFSFSAEAVQDHVGFFISSTPRDLEVAFQLAWLLLTDSRIEPSAFDHTIVGMREGFVEEEHDAITQVARVVSELTTRDPRNRMLAAENLDRLDRETTEAWLRSLLRRGPIEVTVVGDIEQDAAITLVQQYLGSLPTRDMTFESIRARRGIEIQPGPYRARRSYRSQEPVAHALLGFRSTDLQDMARCRHLRLAARILSTRLNNQIRDRMQLVYSIEAVNRPSEVHPDLGFFGAGSFCDPAATERLIEGIDGLFTSMANEGPTDDEVDVAVRQIVTKLRDDVQTPGYWLSWLSAFHARERRIEDLRNHREHYRSIDASQIRETFGSFFTEDRRLEIEVLPTQDPTDDTASGSSPAD